jgi:hypothetical protein
MLDGTLGLAAERGAELGDREALDAAPTMLDNARCRGGRGPAYPRPRLLLCVYHWGRMSAWRLLRFSPITGGTWIA